MELPENVNLSHIALAAQDGDLRQRVTACAAYLNHPNPADFAQRNMWNIAADPAIAADYSYAVATTPEYTTKQYGLDPAIVGDDQILTAVESLMNDEIGSQ